MANEALFKAFERMWQHVVAKLADKASKTESQNYALDAANTVKNDLLNSKKAEASGETLTLTDVSPVEHTLSVAMRRKNLLTYPYIHTTKTVSGITFTDNGDGSVTISGTATGDATFILSYYQDFGDTNINAIYSEGATNGSYYVSKRLSYNATNSYKPVSIVIANGTTVDETLFPMVNEGTTAEEYAPYIADLTTATVTTSSKNLIDASDLVAEGNSAWTSKKVGVFSLSPGQYVGSVDFVQEGDLSNVAFDIRGVDDASIRYGGKESSAASGQLVVTFTIPEGVSGCSIFVYSNNTGNVLSTRCAFSNFQVEKGTTATAYEPYQQGASYTPKADGTIEGVTSISPTMILSSNTDGVIIDCEYISQAGIDLLNNYVLKSDYDALLARLIELETKLAALNTGFAASEADMK